MGKLMDRLQKQLKTEYRQDAEDCLVIYNYLLESTGHVYDSVWSVLVSVTFIGSYPKYERRFKPTSIGYLVIKGLNTTQ